MHRHCSTYHIRVHISRINVYRQVFSKKKKEKNRAIDTFDSLLLFLFFGIRTCGSFFLFENYTFEYNFVYNVHIGIPLKLFGSSTLYNY